MKKGLRLAFRRGDLLAVALVVLLAIGVAACFVPREKNGSETVQIFHEGVLIHELPLDRDDSCEISGEYKSIVSIKDGRAGFADSDCPGRDCVHSRWIGDAGRSIVCLPNRVEIRISGASDVDFVVR